MTQSDSGTTQYSYDDAGNLTSIASPEGTVSYQYDNLDRKTATIDGTGSNPLRTISYAYDDLGRLHTVSDNVTSDPGLVTAYHYNLQGNLVEKDLPNGIDDVMSYNNVNQLTSLIEYAPGALESPPSYARIAEYDYLPRADGTESELRETFWTTNGTLTNTFDWTYDNLNRLTEEKLNSSDSDRNYTATYTYDLVGNRKVYSVTGADNQTTTSTYNYDANDRLTDEDSSSGTTTTYTYNYTQEKSKVVTQGTVTTSSTAFTYDFQGNLQTAVVDTYSSSGAFVSQEKLTYGYDATGIRVSALDQIKTEVNGPWEQQTLTEYLNDPQNATGYSQVLRETHTDPTTQQITKVLDYTWGLQGIAQTVSTYANGQPTGSTTDVFGLDGHGSVRVLTNMAATIAQLYVYDAYGNMKAIYNVVNGAFHFVSLNAADALTTYLYSGQQFDSQTGMQYLRARYYDPNTGRFNQLDKFLGSFRDPLSLHKYLYTHGNPINNVDPSGRAEFTLAGVTVQFNADFSLRSFQSTTAFRTFVNVLASDILIQLPQLCYLVDVLGLLTGLACLLIDNIPDSYTNPNQGTNEPIEPYEVGEYADLAKRAEMNGQSGQFRIHHVPQKALAENAIKGYQSPPSPNEPCIALPVTEHATVTRGQATNALLRFQSPPIRNNSS